MPLPKYIVRLTDEERSQLDDLIRTGKRAAAVLTHARILLKPTFPRFGHMSGQAGVLRQELCNEPTAELTRLFKKLAISMPNQVLAVHPLPAEL